MPRTNHEQVDALLDPLTEYNWDLIIPLVPGVQGFDASDFKTRIMSTELPGRTIEPIPQLLHGVNRNTAGMVRYTQQMNFTLMETRDLRARDVLQGWHRYCRNDSSLGTYYNEYTTTVVLRLFDDHDKAIRDVNLHRCWLESFQDVSLDGGSNSAVIIQGQLNYFRWTENDSAGTN